MEDLSLYRNARRLIIYRSILEDPACATVLDLLQLLAQKESDAEAVVDAYHSLVASLATCAENNCYQVGNTWQNHLLNLILWDENPFTRQIQYLPLEEMGQNLVQSVFSDLNILQDLYQLDSEFILNAISRWFIAKDITEWGNPLAWPSFQQFSGPGNCSGALWDLKQSLASARDWRSCLPRLAVFHKEQGSGLFCRFNAFRWQPVSEHIPLHGIADSDPITFENLVGYEKEREEVLKNTIYFLQGLPANNILLYGDRGTGKSSTVKALLNRFSHQGLRLIEVNKQQMGDIPQIYSYLKKRSQKFILFIDDLSFEENETFFKDLKAILEGGLEHRPANVLFYATSNRRHLVREYFSDREGLSGSQEVRARDTLEEKLSLADRFGITIIFPTPGEAEYLAIVQGLADQSGISIDQVQLRRKAIEWAMWHNGRSGRTARQFVNHLISSSRDENVLGDGSTGSWLQRGITTPTEP
jgi:predicted AAA+ superfamily ATPase